MMKLLRGLMALACASLLVCGPVAAPAYAQVAGNGPACVVKDAKGNCIGGASDPASMPGTKAEAVVTSDSTDQWTVPNVPRAIYVGGAGDIVMVGADAASGAAGVTWKAVPVGTIIPFRPRRIMTTNTSATNLVAIF